MVVKEFNREPKGLDTKWGGRCTVLYVNWEAFDEQDEDEQDDD